MIADAILAHLSTAQAALSLAGPSGGAQAVAGAGDAGGGGGAGVGGADASAGTGAGGNGAGALPPPSKALSELRFPSQAFHKGSDRIAPRRCFDTRHLPVDESKSNGFEYVSHEIVRTGADHSKASV